MGLKMFELYNGDCITILKNIPDKSIDSIITDPPYGTTNLKWDSVINLEELWYELKRVRKPIIMFGTQPFTTVLISSNMDEFKYCLVWEKTKAGNFQQAPNCPLKKHEDIIVFSDGVVGHVSQTSKRMTYNPQGLLPTKKIIKREMIADPHGFQRKNGIIKGFTQNFENYPSSVLKFGSVHNPPHPTQKPIELMEYTYSNTGDTILDFTMGSGTTGVAAIKNKRKFVGIEMDKNYFDIAKNRMEEVANISSFFEME
jgi:site-specific DNA-methyltransferase (adenine-specific)